MANIVFYTTYSFTEGYVSGGTVRPEKFLKYLQKSSHEITTIIGNSEERARALASLKEKVKKGYQIDMVYCELGALPFMLTDQDHIPRRPCLDITIIRYLKNLKIPFAAYYRDVYWKFPEMSTGSFIKNMIKQIGHIIEIRFINRHTDIFYLQSREMIKFLPEIKNPEIKILMPGTEPVKVTRKKKRSQKLKIFYVGGMGILYKMHAFIEAVSLFPDEIELTICCRPKEWNNVKHEYEPLLKPNIQIISGSGDELVPYLREADIFHFCLEPHKYRKFVMPVKLFEYLSYRKPIFASQETMVGEFIAKEKIGWSVRYDAKSIAAALKKILKDPQLLSKMQKSIDRVSQEHSWENRIKQIVDDCLSLR